MWMTSPLETDQVRGWHKSKSKEWADDEQPLGLQNTCLVKNKQIFKWLGLG